MGYRLKSGLCKTLIHQVVSLYVPEGVVLPHVRLCDFKRFRNTYWLNFTNGDHVYHGDLSVYCYGAPVCFTHGLNIDDETSIVWSQIAHHKVPFEYLPAHHMLREVA